MNWFGFFIGILVFSAVLFLLYLTGRDKPLFKTRCKDCGKKDRDWTVVPVGHDEFAWQHNCKENTDGNYSHHREL